MTQLRFYNVWEADSADKRDELIDVMRRDAVTFADRPGFVSLQAWASETDNRVIVEATWTSRHAFDAAVSASADTQAQRERMQTLAKAAPAVFTLAFTQLPNQRDSHPDNQEEHHE